MRDKVKFLLFSGFVGKTLTRVERPREWWLEPGKPGVMITAVTEDDEQGLVPSLSASCGHHGHFPWLGNRDWGVSSRQQLLPTCCSLRPQAPRRWGRCRWLVTHRWWHPGHICPTGRCSRWLCLFQGVISGFLAVEEDRADSHDTQSLPQANPPELLFSAAISSHFK